MNRFLLSLSMLLLLASCTKQQNDNGPAPSAFFSYQAVVTRVPAKVTFNNLSQNAAAWNWSFGDGGTSSDRDPVHVYKQPGTYTVRLTATNGGSSDYHTISIQILPAYNFVSIASVKILSIPAGNFDLDGTTPDLTFRITDINHTELYNPGTYYANPTALPLSWTVSPAYTPPSMSSIRKIVIYDYDEFAGIPSYDMVGEAGFIGSIITADEDDPYPAKYLAANGDTRIELGLQWH